MASSSDLCRLSDVKNWLSISGSDDDIIIGQLITQTSRAILAYVDRPSILPCVFTDTYDGGDDASIILRQWPVNKVESCYIDGKAIPQSINATTGLVLESVEVTPPGRPQRLYLRGGLFPGGIQNIVVNYSAGYLISGEQATVPAQSPYTLVASAPYGSWTNDNGVFTNDGPLIAVKTNPGSGQFAVADGVYSFSAINAGSQVKLNYGYVPADLAVGCLEWVADRYSYRTRIGQQSKSLGGQETMTFIVKEIPDYVVRLLQPYRRVIGS